MKANKEGRSPFPAAGLALAYGVAQVRQFDSWKDSMLRHWFRGVVILFVWVATFRLALSVSNWPGDWGHGVCGPWGCGPPLQAIVGCHTAWMVFLAPGSVVARRMLLPRHRDLVGALVIMTAIVGVIVDAGGVLRLAVLNSRFDYLPQRIGFEILTQVDFPLLELLVCGLIIMVRLSRSVRKAVNSDGALAPPEETISIG